MSLKWTIIRIITNYHLEKSQENPIINCKITDYEQYALTSVLYYW